MKYSVLTKVTNGHYNGQKFYMYRLGEETLTTFTEGEAKTLEKIFNGYPTVFSEIEVVPRENREIKLLEDFWGENGKPLDFEVEMIADDCPGIIDLLQNNFDTKIVGIDRDETVRQTFKNE